MNFITSDEQLVKLVIKTASGEDVTETVVKDLDFWTENKSYIAGDKKGEVTFSALVEGYELLDLDEFLTAAKIIADREGYTIEQSITDFYGEENYTLWCGYAVAYVGSLRDIRCYLKDRIEAEHFDHKIYLRFSVKDFMGNDCNDIHCLWNTSLAAAGVYELDDDEEELDEPVWAYYEAYHNFVLKDSFPQRHSQTYEREIENGQYCCDLDAESLARSKMEKFLKNNGYTFVKKLNQYTSYYSRDGKMYAATVEENGLKDGCFVTIGF